MADSFTSLLRLVQQTNAGNINIWGKNFNEGVAELIETAIAARQDIDVTLASVALTLGNGVPDTSRAMFLHVQGVPGVKREVIVPSLQKMYIVANETSPAFDVEIKTAANAGLLVSGGETVIIFVDQNANVVVSPTPSGAVAILGSAPFLQKVFNITGATAGDTTVTVDYMKQGGLVTVRIPAISTTVAAATFLLAPVAGTLPPELLPSAPLSNDFPFCANEAAVLKECFLRIPNVAGDWSILKTDGAAWTNPSPRVFVHPLEFVIHQVLP